MDKLDARILAELRMDARISVTALSKKLGTARTTLQARLERLESTGVIGAYTIRMGEEAKLARIHATVLLQIDPRALSGIVQKLKKVSEVEALHTTSGRYDLALELATDTTAKLDEVLDMIGGIDGVKSSESLIHLSTKFDRSL